MKIYVGYCVAWQGVKNLSGMWHSKEKVWKIKVGCGVAKWLAHLPTATCVGFGFGS